MRRFWHVLCNIFIIIMVSLACSVQAQTTILGTNTVGPIQNSSTTGTTLYRLAKVVTTGGISTALIAATTDTAIPLYIVTFGPGTTGLAMLNIAGVAPCIFDSATSNMAGKYVVASTSSPGACHVQTSPPTNGFVIGTLWDNNTVDGTVSGATALVQSGNLNYIPGTPGSGSGTVASGTIHSLAYYSGTPDATTVDDLPAVPTANRYLKGNGTDWATSAGSASGVGPCTNTAVTALNSDAPPTCSPITSAFVNNTIGITGADLDTSNPSQVTGATGAFSLKGDLTPTALGGNVNDYNPANLATASTLRLDGGAANRSITGLAGGVDGRLMLMRNVGATNTITLTDQSTASSAANRFALTSDITLQPGMSVALTYDAVLTRWTALQNAVLDANASRSCEVDIGSISAGSPAVASDEHTTTTCGNRFGKAWKLTAFACKVSNGSAVVQPILTGGSATSIVGGNVTCGTAWTPGTMSATPIVNSFGTDGAACATAPCTVDLNLVSVTGATRIQMVLIGSLQR